MNRLRIKSLPASGSSAPSLRSRSANSRASQLAVKGFPGAPSVATDLWINQIEEIVLCLCTKCFFIEACQEAQVLDTQRHMALLFHELVSCKKTSKNQVSNTTRNARNTHITSFPPSLASQRTSAGLWESALPVLLALESW